MTDGTGTTITSYDATSEVTQVASPEGTIGYAYAKDGERSSMTRPGPTSSPACRTGWATRSRSATTRTAT